MVSNQEHLVGPYRITTDITTKEETVVYHAFDRVSKKNVLLRFLNPQGRLSDSLERRFEHSAVSLQQLKHPNLVPIIDHGIHREVPYIVSPILIGSTLREKLTKPLPWAQAARLLTPAAKALAYLHENHIFHRNLRSENIILDKGFMLADAGVQQLIDLVNPPGKKTKIDPLSKDIHDLGLVFYEMVSGEIKTKIDAVDLSKLVKDFDTPAVVMKVLKRALGLEMPQYQTVSAFVQDLETLGWGGQARNKKDPVKAAGDAKAQPARAKVSPSRSSRRKRQSKGWLIPVTILVLAAIIVGFVLVNNLNQDTPTIANLLPSQTSASNAELETHEETEIGPTATSPTQADPVVPVAPSPEPSETSVPIPTTGIGSTMTSPVDGMTMVYVPAGEFFMGSNDRETNERPMHGVYLDAFWIDRTEVTNSMYAACESAGVCTPPVSFASSQRKSYYNDPAFANYPVIFVNWNQANTYCQWASKRLPTEAEWEKAARGTDAQICPWGNTSPAPDRLNFNTLVGDTSEVGSYPNGASPYGALDMSGNVWEWVSDWYSSSYYAQSPSDNPSGPVDGTRHVLRGGSWYYDINYIRSAFRFRADANTALNDVGFRCVLPASP